jgi:hypothetical protein
LKVGTEKVDQSADTDESPAYLYHFVGLDEIRVMQISSSTADTVIEID